MPGVRMKDYQESYSPRSGERLLFFKQDGTDYIFKQRFIKGKMTKSLYVTLGTFIASFFMMIGFIGLRFYDNDNQFSFGNDGRILFAVCMLIFMGGFFILMTIWILRKLFGTIRIPQDLNSIKLNNLYMTQKQINSNDIQSIKYSLKPYGRYKRLHPMISVKKNNKREVNVLIGYDQKLMKDFGRELAEILNKPVTGFE